MPRLALETQIDAPVERVFHLSRSIDLHATSMERNREYPVAGVTSGLIGEGECVTWRARHFGLWLELESRIVQFNPPRHFRDVMIRGPFKRFDHDHYFESIAGGTLMRDVFDYTSPLSLLGRVADHLFLEKYMTRLLDQRNKVIKSVAESDSWRHFLPPGMA